MRKHIFVFPLFFAACLLPKDRRAQSPVYDGAVVAGDFSAHEHIVNAHRRKIRLLECGPILDGVGIEDHHIRVAARRKAALLAEADPLGGHEVIFSMAS